MRIVLTHVTRMVAPRICVAGIDERTHQHIRPVASAERPITRDVLAADGGIVELGALVDLGDATARPIPPEVEDHDCDLDDARLVRRLAGDEYLALLDAVSHDDLMLGLARAFRAAGDDRDRHWLQINGVCLADRPLGETP